MSTDHKNSRSRTKALTASETLCSAIGSRLRKQYVVASKEDTERFISKIGQSSNDKKKAE